MYWSKQIIFLIMIIAELTNADGTLKIIQIDDKIKKLLPNKQICGLQHSDDYLHTTNSTVLTDFPWLALITDGVVPFICSGVLINTKYVLTAAQCLTKPNLRPVIVRLGEYHRENETDCIEDSKLFECSDSVQDYGIAKIITHPEYVHKTYPLHALHDIALIRLNKTVRYTDYIRPICLPLPGLKRAKTGTKVVSSGWGLQPLAQTISKIKKRTYSRLITNEVCSEMFHNISLELEEEPIWPKGVYPELDNFSVTVGQGDVCGMVVDDDPICGGDEGAPVMYFHKLKWRLQGIISMSSLFCNEYSPSVFTNVAYYLEWIFDNLEA